MMARSHHGQLKLSIATEEPLRRLAGSTACGVQGLIISPMWRSSWDTGKLKSLVPAAHNGVFAKSHKEATHYRRLHDKVQETSRKLQEAIAPSAAGFEKLGSWERGIRRLEASSTVLAGRWYPVVRCMEHSTVSRDLSPAVEAFWMDEPGRGALALLTVLGHWRQLQLLSESLLLCQF